MTQSFDTLNFRRVLGSFATGVTIITTVDAQGRFVGVTASSFNSVSLEPALVLWSAARRNASHDIFVNAVNWAVHVLREDQRELSNRFASAGSDRFGGLDVRRGSGGVPLLPGCAAVLECSRYACYDGGDHSILVGEVQGFNFEPCDPLLFHAGRYARLWRDESPAHGSASSSVATQA